MCPAPPACTPTAGWVGCTSWAPLWGMYPRVEAWGGCSNTLLQPWGEPSLRPWGPGGGGVGEAGSEPYLPVHPGDGVAGGAVKR